MAFLVGCLTCMAQDVIIKKDGRRLEGRVVKITDKEVEYRKLQNPEGPIYTIEIADLIKVEFENGTSEVFVKEDLGSNIPATVFPGMTGEVKDTELYSKYKDFQDKYKIPKRLRRIGVWGGCCFVGLGLIAMGEGTFDLHQEWNRIWTTTGICLSSFGVVWGVSFYALAHFKQKQIDSMYELASLPLFRQSILTTKEGRSFSIGVDYLANHDKTSTLGLGFTYLF